MSEELAFARYLDELENQILEDNKYRAEYEAIDNIATNALDELKREKK